MLLILPCSESSSQGFFMENFFHVIKPCLPFKFRSKKTKTKTLKKQQKKTTTTTKNKYAKNFLEKLTKESLFIRTQCLERESK